MKITDAEIIKNGEQELIDAITADLDWGAIEEIFLKEHNLGIEEDIEYKSGDIIAFDNQIAYKLEFEVKVHLSVLLNRNGEYLSINIRNKNEDLKNKEKNSGETEFLSEESENHTDMDPVDAATSEGMGITDNLSPEKTDPYSLGNLEENDDMGQKVDDILENIKKAG
jgi:hypothetical protein